MAEKGANKGSFRNIPKIQGIRSTLRAAARHGRMLTATARGAIGLERMSAGVASSSGRHATPAVSVRGGSRRVGPHNTNVLLRPWARRGSVALGRRAVEPNTTGSDAMVALVTDGLKTSARPLAGDGKRSGPGTGRPPRCKRRATTTRSRGSCASPAAPRSTAWSRELATLDEQGHARHPGLRRRRIHRGDRPRARRTRGRGPPIAMPPPLGRVNRGGQGGEGAPRASTPRHRLQARQGGVVCHPGGRPRPVERHLRALRGHNPILPHLLPHADRRVEEPHQVRLCQRVRRELLLRGLACSSSPWRRPSCSTAGCPAYPPNPSWFPTSCSTITFASRSAPSSKTGPPSGARTRSPTRARIPSGSRR